MQVTQVEDTSVIAVTHTHSSLWYYWLTIGIT